MRGWAVPQYFPYVILALLAVLLPSQYRHIYLALSSNVCAIGLSFALLLLFGVLNIVVSKRRPGSSVWWIVLPLLPTVFTVAAFARAGGPIGLALLAGFSVGAMLIVFWILFTPSRKAIIVGAVFATAAYLTTVAALVLDPILLPREIGPVAIIVLAMGFISVTLGLLFLKPWLGLVVTGVIAMSLLVTAPNNHRMTMIEKGSDRFDGMFGEVFIKWVNSRKDLRRYKEAHRPYPVILASAEGGGIYAAAHGYAALSSFQLRCPSFSQHLFATVGVSGGSFGTLLFAQAAKVLENGDLKPCSSTDETPDLGALETDHLTPVLARMLFPEFLDAVLPGQWVGEDRGIILSKSIAQSAGLTSEFESSLFASWNPQGASPMTMFVSTDVQLGQRLVFSPVAGEGFAEWFPSVQMQSDRDVRLGEAAAASARFPWVTPTAKLQVTDKIFRVLGDGGYFENSGAETVLDIVRSIEHHAELKRFDKDRKNYGADPNWTRCQLIVEDGFKATSAWNGCDTHVYFAYFPITSRTSQTVGDISENSADPIQSFVFDPLQTMMSTREGRANLALDRAKERFCGIDFCVQEFTSDSGIFEQVLPLSVIDLPLGWYLSNDEASLISDAVPSAKCAKFDEAEFNKSYSAKLAKLNYLFLKARAGEGEEGDQDPVDTAFAWLNANACNAETMAYLFNPQLASGLPYGIDGFNND